MIDEIRIKEMRARCNVWLDESASLDAINDAEIGLQSDVPDLLDALESAQAENERLRGNSTEWTDEATSDVEAIEKKHDIELVSIVYCEQLHDNFQAEHTENERLREALKQAEQKCRRLVGTKTADHHVAILDECRVCGARFSSMVPNRGQPHKDGCPFKLLEPLLADSGQKSRENAGDWNYEIRTCRKCGVMFKRIDGVWTGEHRDQCPGGPVVIGKGGKNGIAS